MHKISAVGLFGCDIFEETTKQKVIDLSKLEKFYFKRFQIWGWLGRGDFSVLFPCPTITTSDWEMGNTHFVWPDDNLCPSSIQSLKSSSVPQMMNSRIGSKVEREQQGYVIKQFAESFVLVFHTSFHISRSTIIHFLGVFIYYESWNSFFQNEMSGKR